MENNKPLETLEAEHARTPGSVLLALNPLYPVVGRREDGSTVWYTGRAGVGFVSVYRSEAFEYVSLEVARRKALNLNRGTALHGIRFVAVAGDGDATTWQDDVINEHLGPAGDGA